MLIEKVDNHIITRVESINPVGNEVDRRDDQRNETEQDLLVSRRNALVVCDVSNELNELFEELHGPIVRSRRS